MKKITKKIKIERVIGIQFRLPLSHIARELGVSRQLVWAWAHGKRKVNEEHMKKLEEIGA
jgi:transcriptional regulator with XRE-family HTH domain